MSVPKRPLSGNPLLPGRGLCDPHVRIFNDKAYLYATHDLSPDAAEFVMADWWVWSSPDLLRWTHECTLRPQDTYLGPGFRQCWATDAAERNGKFYWFFSDGNRRTGVVVADSPVGPWRDPLRRPLIGDGLVPVGAYDPGFFLDQDGSPYLVFGVWDYYLARLNDDLLSLAEPPRQLTIHRPEGPYGPGRTDDKPYLHHRGGIYYLSWGCYYAMADRLFGPYECRGSIITEENVAPDLRYQADAVPNLDYPDRLITYDRHGSFFLWHNQWFFICNDMSQTRNIFFRDSSLAYVFYRPNGEIEPLRLDPAGVCLPD